MRRQALAGLLAQTTQGAGAIGIILVIRGHAGSLSLAGAVVGATSVTAGLARPVQGRLIDRRGAWALMVLCGIAHPASLAGIVLVADRHGAALLLMALGVLAGVTLPPVSTCMRVAWGARAGEDRTAAYSLVYLTQELSILIGPLLLALLVAAATASVALIAVAAVASVGTLAFAVSLPRATASAPASPLQRGGAVLRARGLVVLIATGSLVGAVIGGIEVGVPTFASAHRAPAASGVLIAVLSIGGIGGAAIYGARQWRVAPTPRLLVLLTLLWVTVALAAVAPGTVALGIVLALVGLPLNPCLTTISVIVDAHVGPAAAAEAFGWLSSGIAGGTGAASAIAGAVSRPGHPRPAFVVAAMAAAAGMCVVAAARGTLARPAVRSRAAAGPQAR